MENLNTQVDLYLTEISIEMLGNQMYNLNGKRQNKLLDLFKAVPATLVENKHENSNDILCKLGYDKNFIESSDGMANFLEDQMDFTLVDANNTPKTNKSIINYLKQYKSDQNRLMKDVSEIHVRKLVERNKITAMLNKARMEVSQQSDNAAEKHQLVKKHYNVEKDQLLKACTSIQRLIKFIINDTECEIERGELIGFVHALRSIRQCENQTTRKSNKIAKPYMK